VQGDQLVWNLGDLEAGQGQSIKVWIKAQQEGRISSCASVAASPRVCSGTLVGKPLLAIEKTGPALIVLGDDVSYNIQVSNPGSAVAKDVVVTDVVPDGLTHSSGQSEVTFNVGDLSPKESKSIPVAFKSTKRGKVCNVAVARSSNAGEARAEACTTVALLAVKFTKDGDKQQLIGKVANYRIVVANEGDIDIPDFRLTDTAPDQTTIVAAEGATVTGNTATWAIPMLEKGTEKSFEVKLTSRVPGNKCNVATLTGPKGGQYTAQACTEWIGVTGVLLELVDDPDPIQVGETTSFTIRVTNQSSTGSIQELNVKSIFRDEIDPLNPSSGGTIDGKTVTWPTVPLLEPKKAVTYTVVGKALKPGDHRMEVQVTTRMRTNPIVSVESTTVY
jgi:uncharacterized repeat protein (TIGR01451 family)